MIQWMLAIWTLVLLPFQNPVCTSGSSRFKCYWSLSWRTLSITLLVCEMSAIVHLFEHSLSLALFWIGMKTDLFQSCGYCWVFQICWHIECSTFIALFFRIWNSSTGIPSPPLALMTSKVPWFMDLTFQLPMQYCSLQHQTLHPSPVTSTTGHCFCFFSISSFFLKLFLCHSPVTYWAPTDLGSSSFSVLSFCLFILFRGFSSQEYWSGLPFPSPVGRVLSELSTMTHLSWVALHGMAHSFIELDKAVVHVVRLVSFLWLWFSVCLPADGEG